MKISVLINSFNHGEYIEEAIKSVLTQNYARNAYEIIIVDACSTDNTNNVLKWYNSEIMVVSQTEKPGLAAGCNLGIRACSGEYVVRLDADDLFCQNILLVETLFLDENPEIDFVYPDYFSRKDGEKKRIRLPKYDSAEICKRGDFLGGGTMYRRDLFEKYGYYDESLRSIENYELVLRFIKNGATGLHIKLPLFFYNIYENSMSTDRKLLKEAVRIIEEKHGIEYSKNRYHPRNIDFQE